MAVPFRRKSSKKSREGRSSENLKFKKNAFPTLIRCTNCNEPKVIHEICKSCLTYKSLSIKSNS
ncbi:MAG: 50S ribosomal protein L32 [Mycoplasmataceae bacterium]|nr:MAG: 50S ribosomal protein L32 [Mycoplasmataceae bacterium]